MQIHTHLAVDWNWCGTPVALGGGRATLELETTSAMAADEHGLVHGGFVFGAVDYAAMLAINDPNVVLGAANVRFLAPVKVGQTVVCEARVIEVEGRKNAVHVSAKVGDEVVLSGELTCFVLPLHVLEGREEPQV